MLHRPALQMRDDVGEVISDQVTPHRHRRDDALGPPIGDGPFRGLKFCRELLVGQQCRGLLCSGLRRKWL